MKANKKSQKVLWSEAVRRVMKASSQGVRLRSLGDGLDRRVAERLMDQGRIHGTRLPDGDYLLNK